MENTKEMSKKDLFKKIGSIVLNVFFYVFLGILLLISIANIRSAKTSDGNDRIPNIFGTGFATVLSDSMAPEFYRGDVIKVKIANDKIIKDLKKGDIITFRDPNINKTLNDMNVLNEGYSLNTHRIVDIIENADGTRTFIAQGDYLKGTANEYNNNYDEVSGFVQKVSQEDVKAVYRGKLGNGASKFLNFIKSSTGFALVIVLPTAILLVLEATLLIMNLVKLNREKMNAKIASATEMSEEEKEKMKEELRKQLLEEMSNKQQEEQPKEEVEEKEDSQE